MSEMRIDRLRDQRDKLLSALEQVELCARVNAPIYDGSPMHKAIIKLLAEIEKDCLSFYEAFSVVLVAELVSLFLRLANSITNRVFKCCHVLFF